MLMFVMKFNELMYPAYYKRSMIIRRFLPVAINVNNESSPLVNLRIRNFKKMIKMLDDISDSPHRP